MTPLACLGFRRISVLAPLNLRPRAHLRATSLARGYGVQDLEASTLTLLFWH